MSLYKSEYHRFDGTTWHLHYFKTSADLIVETATYKVMTADERTAISTYLALFNQADKLVKVNPSTGFGVENSKIPSSLIPDLPYLPLNQPLGGSTVFGAVTFNDIVEFSANVEIASLYVTSILSDGGTVTFGGLDSVNFDSAVLINVGDPTLGHHAANKAYVDAQVMAGMRPVAAVKCATTINVTRSGLTTHDGYTLVAGDRILVWKQTNVSENGIYVAAAGAWTRVDADSSKGAYVFVENGQTYNDWYFHASTDTTWIDQGRPDTVKAQAGGGLTRTGNEFLITAGGVTNAMLAGSIAWSKFADTAAADNANTSYDTWPELTAATTAKSLTAHLSMIMAAIGLLRGTANYNTNNTQTIAGAYVIANAKNKTEIGASVPTANPATHGAGDVFLKTLSVS